MLRELTSTVGIVAGAAAVLALATLVGTIALAIRLRTVRRAQVAVMGERGERDLVTHAARVERGFVELRDWVEEMLGAFEARVGRAEHRIDGCVAYRALIRYDAYGEMSGQQSSSVALLDEHRSGIVISSILHRDQARVYVKKVQGGESELDLSPEEREAIETALAPAGG